MSCLICQRTKPIPICNANLIIGNIGLNNTAVYIYVQDLSTGATHRQSATSSGAGLVTLSMALPVGFYSPDHTYELWITLQSATNILDRKDITIGVEVNNCLNPIFQNIVDANNINISYTTQTIALEI